MRSTFAFSADQTKNAVSGRTSSANLLFIVDQLKNPKLYEILRQRNAERVFENDSSERDLIEPPQKR